MTRLGLMRTLLPSRLIRSKNANAALKLRVTTDRATTAACDSTFCMVNCRCFAQVHDIDRHVWLTSTIPCYVPPGQESDHEPPDERTLQLGRTVRELHERLPTLLQSPLPADILSPQISLHLFPSTHPHLPTVSGRIAYNAALWTAPVAWGRMPLIGNVKLTILSERMVRNGGSAVPLDSREEKLIVKWKTCGKTRHRDPTGGVYRASGAEGKDPMEKIKDFIAGTQSSPDARVEVARRVEQEEKSEFCGIFVFEFDEKGRILKHTIEHTEEGGHWDKMTRVVSVTDWLLGRFNGKGKEQLPELALCEERPTGWRIRSVDRRARFD